MDLIETKTQLVAVNRSALAYLGVVCVLVLNFAAPANSHATASGQGYVDSVYSWGIWELGLEPAPGPQTPTEGAMNDRSRSLQFRPNDNAAYMTQSIPVPQAITAAPPLPSPLPAAPSAPVAPSLPLGPPGFSSGPATTADPRNR